MHLILSLSISYPYLIKLHDFVDNSQEGMKHQMRHATQAQESMTLRITLFSLKLGYNNGRGISVNYFEFPLFKITLNMSYGKCFGRLKRLQSPTVRRLRTLDQAPKKELELCGWQTFASLYLAKFLLVHNKLLLQLILVFK